MTDQSACDCTESLRLAPTVFVVVAGTCSNCTWPIKSIAIVQEGDREQD